MSLAKRFKSGDVVFRQGDAPGAMYVVMEGSLDVIADGLRIATVDKAGSFVGEISFLLGKPRLADLVAQTDTKLLVISDMQAFMKDDPDRALAVARELARRLEAMDGEVLKLRRSLAETLPSDDPQTACWRDLPERLRREAGIA